jgi:hypothetical protein
LSRDVILSYEILQSNVDQNFRMLVRIYLELEEGKVMMLGRAHLTGNTSDSGKVPLKGLKTKPRHDQLLRRRPGFPQLICGVLPLCCRFSEPLSRLRM